MSDAISSLFNMPGLATEIGAATNLASAGSGLYNAYQQQQYQDMLRRYASNPAALQQYAAGFTQPLQAGTIQGINNASQGYAAERGLSQSPALSQQIENQAIAPVIQQEQEQGMQDALRALGLGGGAQPNQAQAMNQAGAGINGLLKLMGLGQGDSPPQINNGQGSLPDVYQPVSPSIPPGAMPNPVPDLSLTDYAFGGS
jgi:hypothetical protein